MHTGKSHNTFGCFLNLFHEYKMSMGLYNGKNLWSGFYILWTNYRQGTHMRWNGSYYCSGYDSHMSRGNCPRIFPLSKHGIIKIVYTTNVDSWRTYKCLKVFTVEDVTYVYNLWIGMRHVLHVKLLNFWPNLNYKTNYQKSIIFDVEGLQVTYF